MRSCWANAVLLSIEAASFALSVVVEAIADSLHKMIGSTWFQASIENHSGPGMSADTEQALQLSALSILQIHSMGHLLYVCSSSHALIMASNENLQTSVRLMSSLLISVDVKAMLQVFGICLFAVAPGEKCFLCTWFGSFLPFSSCL